MWLLYNILFPLVFLCLLPYYLLRMRRRGGYRDHFWQRVARYEPEVKAALGAQQRIWVHSVSVGEVYVGLQLMDEIRRRHPDAAFVLSVTTSTGHAIAQERVSDQDVLIYFPVDIPLVMRKALRTIRPRMLVLVECEFWPNLLRIAKEMGIPVPLVNGRISDSSYRGYRKLRLLTRRIMPLLDPVCVQSRLDRERLIDLGCPPERVHDLGSAKYEVAQPDADKEAAMRDALHRAGLGEDRIILLGGSTWSGEEAILLDLYLKLKSECDRLALVLAPRHMERREEVIREIESRGLSVLCRSKQAEGETAQPAPDVFLIDTTGELRFFYAAADIIFIGKSLTQDGGQNPIEAAFYGKPVLVGPNMQNFPVVMRDFREAGALIQVDDTAALEARIRELIRDEPVRAELGRKAAELVKRKRGAIGASVDLIEQAHGL